MKRAAVFELLMLGCAVALILSACTRIPPDALSPDAGDSPPPVDAAPPTPPPDADPNSPWRLVWQDEFDGPAGQRPDSVNWGYDIGGHGWGNNELQFHTDRATNVSLDGAGNLAIVARREDFGGNAYTSARIKTQGKLEQTYGRFEARIKLPRGQGIWPAFWMLGNDVATNIWPACGEIDILEQRGQQPSVIYGTLHGPGYSGAGGLGRAYAITAANPTEEFHTYAVEWRPGRITWFVDDHVYSEQTASSVADFGPWVYDHPFFIILNVAVGGHFVGSPDASTVFPQTMLVDYVRVYEAR